MYAAAFEQSGFFGPVSFYRNMDANWERSKDIPPPSTPCRPASSPARSTRCISMMPGAAEAMAEALPDFRGATTVEGAGHWVQQEKPAETNAALLPFLADTRVNTSFPCRPSRQGCRGPPKSGREVGSRPVSTWRLCSTMPSTTTAPSPQLRRPGGAPRPHRGRALPRRPGALRPAADAGHGRDPAAQLVDWPSRCSTRSWVCSSPADAWTSTPRPTSPSGPTTMTPATPSRCANYSRCATGSTSWRTTSTTASRT